MSFGYSVSDCVVLVQLAYNTVQNARKACGAHDAMCREVASLHAVLQRVESEARKPDSLLKRAGDSDPKELDTLLDGCKLVLKTVSQILEKYNALSAEKRSVTKLWQKVRFGNGEMLDLATIRAEIATYTQAITLFLNILSMESQGKVEAYMESQGNELKEIKSSLHFAIAKLDARNPDDKSVLTTYAGDDKTVWREFRRELIQEGYSYRNLMRHKKTIQAYIWELADRGVLDDKDPQQQKQDDTTLSQAPKSVQQPVEDGTDTLPTTSDPESVPEPPVEDGERLKAREETKPDRLNISSPAMQLHHERIPKNGPGHDSNLEHSDRDPGEDFEMVNVQDEADISGSSSDESDTPARSYGALAPSTEQNSDDAIERFVSGSKPIPIVPVLQSSKTAIASPKTRYQSYVEEGPDEKVVPQANPEILMTLAKESGFWKPNYMKGKLPIREPEANPETPIAALAEKLSIGISNYMKAVPLKPTRGAYYRIRAGDVNFTGTVGGNTAVEAWSSDSEDSPMRRRSNKTQKMMMDAKTFGDKLKEIPCDPKLQERLKNGQANARWGSASEAEAEGRMVTPQMRVSLWGSGSESKAAMPLHRFWDARLERIATPADNGYPSEGEGHSQGWKDNSLHRYGLPFNILPADQGILGIPEYAPNYPPESKKTTFLTAESLQKR